MRCLRGALLAGTAVGGAEPSDVDRVNASIDGFHVALGTLDVGKVDPFWAHDATVTTINPSDKAIAAGWDAVRESYAETFDFWSELKVTQKGEPQIRVNGAVAWAQGITEATGKRKTGEPIAGVLNFETCVLEKRDGRWLLVSRNVWRVPQ